MLDSQLDTATLSEIFEKHLHGYLSQNTLLDIAVQYGQAYADRAKSIYDAAMDCPVDWKTANMDDGLLALSQFLSQNYPWLSQEAHYRFTGAFIMAWK